MKTENELLWYQIATLFMETFSQQSTLSNSSICFNTQQAEAMKAEVDLTAISFVDLHDIDC